MILRMNQHKLTLYCVSLLVMLILSRCESRFSQFQLESSVHTIDAIGYLGKNVSQYSLDEAVKWLLLHNERGWKEVLSAEMSQVISKFPRSMDVNLYAAAYYLSVDSSNMALNFNKKAERLGANSVFFYKNRSRIYSAIGEFELAIDYINKAVIINSKDPEIYLSKGEVYLNLGDSLSALSYMVQAFESDQNRLDIAMNLAYLYVASRQYKKAEELIIQLSKDSTLLPALNYLTINIKIKQEDTYAANILRSNMLDDGDVKAGMQLLTYYTNEANYDSVIYVSTKILEVDSLNMEAIVSKADSFDKKGYYSSALMYYEQALAIDSLHEEAGIGWRKIKGKIAYLRKLKERREAIPDIDFSGWTKKTIN